MDNKCFGEYMLDDYDEDIEDLFDDDSEEINEGE